jgi:hypothetical protein
MDVMRSFCAGDSSSFFDAPVLNHSGGSQHLEVNDMWMRRFSISSRMIGIFLTAEARSVGEIDEMNEEGEN